MRISIEGNISSGKTQCMRNLNLSFMVYEENVPGWLPFLRNFSIEPRRWAYPMQMKVLVDLSNIPDGVICERSPFTARHVFTKRLHKKGILTEIENRLYLEFYDQLAWKPDAIIWIDTPPEVCYQRLRQRARPGEQTITLQDLEEIDHGHRELFEQISVPLFRVNGDQPEDQVVLEVKQVLSSLTNQPRLPQVHFSRSVKQ